MKYYRIKLSFKGVKEKIWRLLYVPDYITFAQLAIIIDKVFGLDGDGEYHFFGKKGSICIDEYTPSYDEYTPEYESVEIPLFLVMDYVTSMRYQYIIPSSDEAGNYDSLDIRIKVLEQIEGSLKAPSIKDGKGSVRLKDGIIECDSACDVDDLSEWMAEWLKIDRRKIDSRDAIEILDSFTDGKKGIGGRTKKVYTFLKGFLDVANDNDRNSFLENICETIDISKLLLENKNDTIRALNQSSDKADMLPDSYQLMLATEDDVLRDMAMQKNIKLPENADHKKMAETISESMNDPENMVRYLLCLDKNQIESLRRLLDDNGDYHEQPEDDFVMLKQTFYVLVGTDNTLLMPVDMSCIADKIIDMPQYDEERQKVEWVLCCFHAALLLYGGVSLDVILDIVRQRDSSMTIGKLRSMYKSLPPELRPGVISGNALYDFNLEDDEEMDAIMSDDSLPYYIPSQEMVMDLSDKDACYDEEWMQELQKIMDAAFGDNKETETEAIMQIIGMSMFAVPAGVVLSDIISDYGLLKAFRKKSKRLELKRIITGLQQSMRMVAYHGHTPAEAMALCAKDEKKDTEDKIISLSAWKKKG